MMKAEDLDVVARTVYGEARGEARDGKTAVAWVIKNRVDSPKWWGHDWRSVCRKPWQFSCWNDNDPNRAKVEAVTTEDDAFRDCLQASALVMSGEVTDPTKGATHYYAKAMKALPTWASHAVKTAEIGGHVFMKEI